MPVITINTENFENEVIQAETAVLVDFWAEWCGPCRMVAPLVEEIAEEYSDILKVGKINVDDDPDLAQRFDVMGIPTLILFKDGEIKETVVGMRSKADLIKLFTE